MEKILSFLLFLCVSLPLSAIDKGYVEVQNALIKKDGDKLSVSFDIVPGEFRSDSRITLTPVIYNGENRFLNLDQIIIVGKKRDIYDRRTGDMQGDRRLVKCKGMVEKYSTTVPFQDWMQYVGLAVDQVVEKCCNQIEMPREVLNEGTLTYYRVTPYFDATPLQYELTELEKYDLENPFLHPMEDYAKRYDILLKDRDKGTAAVVFKVASSVINMDMSNNSKVLDAISKAFQLIENDPNAILKHIMVAGYASPEGSLALNTRLAGQRAEAVKRFLQTRMKDPAEHLFEVYNGREDWDGLRDKVEKSDMPEKREILEIIDGYTIEQEIRKTKLKQLNGGAPYRYMLENFYPSLRTGGYVQVYYEIDRKATVATAVTDELGRTTWVDPDSPRNRAVTSINKAIELMMGHKFQEALDTLIEFKDDSRAWNNIGVCYMMMGDYAEADKYFLRAAEQGDTDAPKNLEQTGWAKKVNLETV